MKIGRLSRLVTAAEAKSVRDGLAAGTIDVVIGTHAILAKRSISSGSGWWSSTRSSASASPTRSG